MTACKSNCKNIATALEMYASDNKGRYPQEPALLLRGNYLKVVPSCPAAGKDTYSETYVVQSRPDDFTFYCKGENHRKAFSSYAGPKENFPQYNSVRGLVDHP